MYQHQERDGEQNRKPGGKTCVKRYGKCVFKGGGCNGQDKMQY